MLRPDVRLQIFQGIDKDTNTIKIKSQYMQHNLKAMNTEVEKMSGHIKGTRTAEQPDGRCCLL